jgi:hypothetical protein
MKGESERHPERAKPGRSLYAYRKSPLALRFMTIGIIVASNFYLNIGNLMKTLSILFLALSPLVSFAQADCPSSSQSAKICQSTPEAGDHEIAAKIFDSIEVCLSNAEAYLIFTKDSQSVTTKAEAEDRAGGSTFTIREDKGVTFSFSTVWGRPGLATKARLSIAAPQFPETISSTYTCN